MHNFWLVNKLAYTLYLLNSCNMAFLYLIKEHQMYLLKSLMKVTNYNTLLEVGM